MSNKRTATKLRNINVSCHICDSRAEYVLSRPFWLPKSKGGTFLCKDCLKEARKEKGEAKIITPKRGKK